MRFTGDCDERQFDAAVRDAGAFYHSFYFTNEFSVRGDYDIERDIASYGFPTDMRGMRVLDVGAASGWFSFYFAQLGADVTALDITGPSQWDTFGSYQWPRPEEEVGEWMPSFRTMAELLAVNVRRVSGRVYDIPQALAGAGSFDLIFMGSVLLHLRDPIGALAAARSVCGDRLIASTWCIPDGVYESDAVVMDWPTAALGRGNAWFRPTRAALEAWCRAAGFESVDVTRDVALTADRIDPRRNNQSQTLVLADARV